MTPSARPSLLVARELSAGYHGHAVVSRLNLEVREGEIVALLGPNGAGKTTTMLTLAGELPAIEGEVLFDGVATRAPLYVRARNGLALVPEERSVIASLTADENLRVGRCERNSALQIFPELRGLLGRRGGLLSGGEQQMLTLARALGRHPRLLLADELSLGLAPAIVPRLLAAVRRAVDSEGLGVLLVEQYVKHALKVADRVYVMRRGQVVLSGAVDDVSGQVREAYFASQP